MAFQIGSNFELNAQLPLDVRTVVPNITARNALVPSKVYQGSIVYVISEDKYYYYNTSNQWVVFNTGSAGGGSNNFPVENIVYTTGNLDIFDQKRFENATNLEGSPFLYSGLGKYTENYFSALLSGGSGVYNSPTTRNSVVFLNFDKDGEYDINLPNISGSVINDNIKYIISNTYKEDVSINFYDWSQSQKLTGDSASDLFGGSVATNSDGTLLMMGGNGDNSNAGAALVYTGSAVAGWQLRQKLTGDNVSDNFGWSVATNSDGTLLMMGGYGDDDGGSNAGAAYIYTSPNTQFLYQPDFTLNFKTSGIDENQNYTEPFNLQSLNDFVENDSISFYFDENSNWTILDKIQNNFLPEHSHEIEDIAGMPDLENIVYATGNQTISGIKTFSTQISVNNIRPILTGTPVVLNPLYIDVYNGILGYNINFVPSYGLDWKSGILSSNNGAEGWSFTKRPTVNGTGVLLSGEATQTDLSSTVRTTGDQPISGVKTFINTTRVDSVNFTRNFITTGTPYNFSTSGVVINDGPYEFVTRIYTGWNNAIINPSDDNRSIKLSSGSYINITVSGRNNPDVQVAWFAIKNTGDSNPIQFNLLNGGAPVNFIRLGGFSVFNFSGFLPREYDRIAIGVLGSNLFPLITVSGDFGIQNEIILESRNNRLFLGNSGVLFQGESVLSNGTINSMIRLTQAQYNALSPKDSTTFYVIVG